MKLGSDKPDISKLRVFGSKTIAHEDGLLKKWDCRSKKPLTMVGYDEIGYRLWDLSSRRITIHRNVKFDEQQSPEVVINTTPDEKSGESLNTKLIKKNVLSNSVTPNTPSTVKRRVSHEEAYVSSEEEDFHGFTDDEEEVRTPVSTPTPVTVRRVPTIARRNATRACRKDLQLKSLALSVINWVNNVPLSYKEVSGRDDEDKWLKAIDNELESLEKNQTWEIVPKPEKTKLIDTKWVFKVKEDPHETRYKAKLVLRGFQQRHGTDYIETYSPVARMATIRAILAISVKKKHTIRHLDVTTAFLYGNLDEDVYLRTPEGLEIPDKMTLKLLRSLYGLKQSPKCWNNRFHNFITSISFVRSKADYCLYTLKDGDKEVIIVLYVDDVLLSSNDAKSVKLVVHQLSEEFKMKDLGAPERFMGINIGCHSEGSIELDQTHYITKILEKFGMLDCKPVATPIDPNLQLSRGSGEPTKEPYRELMGSLMYLAIGTRPDISFVVNYMSRFQEGANEEHYKQLKRILRYLQGTKELKLKYIPKDDSKPLEAWVDSDFAANLDDRKSTSGFVIEIYNCPVLWVSRKQSIVTLSSAEAEFEVCAVVYFRKILKDLNIDLSEPTTVYEDNQGAIAMSKNPETRRTKHMDVRFNYICECVETGKVKLEYVQTNKQKADILTKGLSKDKMEILRTAIMALGMSGIVKVK